MSGGPTDVTDGRASDPWRSAIALASCVLVAVASLVTLERLAAGRIEAARAARLGDALAAVLPDVPFDDDPAIDRVTVSDPALGGVAPLLLYRVRRDGRPVGAALSVVAPDGYGGPIELLVGVDTDGRVAAVRVTGHRETPGLGDRIERRRSDWIARFDGRALDAGDPRGWRVVRAGARGDDEFDALTGATITSRAVVDAVHRALVWFEANRETVFAAQATEARRRSPPSPNEAAAVRRTR